MPSSAAQRARPLPQSSSALEQVPRSSPHLIEFSTIPESFRADRIQEFLEPLAARAIRQFFRGKFRPSDPRIAVDFLNSPRNILLVMNINLIDALNRLWRAWPDNARERQIANAIQRQGGIAPKVQEVLNVLEECARRDVPKSFAGGILLLYFELIHDVPLGVAG
jgi:hypothetical protein